MSYVLDQSSADDTSSTYFGYTGDQEKYGQSFTPSVSGFLAKIAVIPDQNGAPSDSLRMKIYSDNAGQPGTLLATSTNTILGSTLTGTLREFFFSGISLSSSTLYWFIIERTGATNTTDYYRINRDSSGAYGGGDAVTTNDGGATWIVLTGEDVAFDQYYTAKRYWVGGSGEWNDTAHWSTTSGGSSGASIPDTTVYDHVIFDANSFSSNGSVVTCNTSVAYASLFDASAVTETVTFKTTGTSLVITFTEGIVLSNTITLGTSTTEKVELDFGATSAGTRPLTVGTGTHWLSYLNLFNDAGLASSALIYDMGSPLKSYMECTLFLQGITFNTNNYDIEMSTVNISADAVVFNAGTSTITAQFFNINTGMTISAASSTLVINKQYTDWRSVGGLSVEFDTDTTFGTITVNDNGTSAYIYLAGIKATTLNLNTGILANLYAQSGNSPTFGTINFAGSSETEIDSGTTVTATTWNFNGTLGNNVIIRTYADGVGTYTLTDSSGTNTGNYLNIKNSIVTGGASWVKGTGFVDLGNTGWIDAATGNNANNLLIMGVGQYNSLIAQTALYRVVFYLRSRMTKFGQLGNQAGTSSSSVDRRVASLASCLYTERAVSMTFRVHLSSAGTGRLKGIIYSDNAASPDELLAVTDEQTFTNTAEAEVTALFSGDQRIILYANTDYWIGFHQEDPGTPSVVRSQGSTAGLQASETDVYATGTNTPWGVATFVSGPLDVYVTTEPLRQTEYADIDKNLTNFSQVNKIPTAHTVVTKQATEFIGAIQ